MVTYGEYGHLIPTINLEDYVKGNMLTPTFMPGSFFYSGASVFLLLQYDTLDQNNMVIFSIGSPNFCINLLQDIF